jgi:hypothetical protein
MLLAICGALGVPLSRVLASVAHDIAVHEDAPVIRAA